MAQERNVPPRQGSSALSRPMREDSPAARTTPANEGESAMLEVYLQLLEDCRRFCALHVRQRSLRTAPDRDQLCDDGHGNLFRRDGADVDPNRSIDARQLFRGNSFFLQLFVDGDDLAL